MYTNEPVIIDMDELNTYYYPPFESPSDFDSHTLLATLGRRIVELEFLGDEEPYVPVVTFEEPNLGYYVSIYRLKSILLDSPPFQSRCYMIRNGEKVFVGHSHFFFIDSSNTFEVDFIHVIWPAAAC